FGRYGSGSGQWGGPCDGRSRAAPQPTPSEFERSLLHQVPREIANDDRDQGGLGKQNPLVRRQPQLGERLLDRVRVNVGTVRGITSAGDALQNESPSRAEADHAGGAKHEEG